MEALQYDVGRDLQSLRSSISRDDQRFSAPQVPKLQEMCTYVAVSQKGQEGRLIPRPSPCV